MATPAHPRRLARFGAFEVDLDSGELRRSGVRISLQEQPFQLLAALLERPGELVTREDLQHRLWPADTYVDFDRSLNKAASKLREALGDHAETPRFVETIPRRGYRFVAPVESVGGEVKPEVSPSPPTVARTRWRSVALPGVAVVMVALAGLGIWLLRSRADSPVTYLRAIPLTAYPGFERDPSFSPDGNQIAFSWNGERQDNYDIYVKLIGPGAPLRLTTDPEQDRGPAWSPDGRWIAFVRFPSNGQSAVFVIPALGGPERKLGDLNARGSIRFTWLAWTKDSRWLVVSDAGLMQDPGGLFLLSIETGERRRLTSVPSSDPAVSPDGRQLAFVRFSGQNVGDVHLVDLSEDLGLVGEPRRLTSLNQVAASPVWTPDGREVLFSSGGYWDRRRLWRIAASRGSSPRPEPMGEDSGGLAVSWSARRLAYVRDSLDSDVWRINLRGPGEPAGPPVKLISSTRPDWSPEYSPDGKRIAFASHRSGSQEIWVSNADGTNPVQSTSSAGPLTSNPRWSPDGQSILFDSHSGGPRDLYLISPDGGRPRRLTSGPELGSEARWSRDGKWIYFVSDRSGRKEAWKMPASGGAPVQVTKNGGAAAFESTDGRLLYYAKSTRTPTTLWKVPVGGGEETQVSEAPLSYSSNFVVVEEGIYFVSARAWLAPGVLYFFSFATRALKPVATVSIWSYGLAISPDRRSILYSQFDQAGSDLMLVENFR